MGDWSQHADQIQGPVVVGGDSQTGPGPAAPHLGTAALSGGGDHAVSGGVHAWAAAEQRLSDVSGWSGRARWIDLARGLDLFATDRWRVEGCFGDSGISPPDSAALSFYWRAGSLRLPGARGADCRPGDAGHRTEREGLHSAALGLC